MTQFVTDGEIGCVDGGLAFHRSAPAGGHVLIHLCCVVLCSVVLVCSEWFAVLAAAVVFV